MTNPAERDRFVTVDEYVAIENASPLKYEYVGGRMHVMSGVNRQHSRIVMNVGSRLFAAARGGPCRIHQSDVKVRISDVFYYPDIMAACGTPPRDLYIEDAPSALVEVLSPSTERTDRREKVIVYRGVASLDTYVIVEQERRWVERHWRDASRTWQRETIIESGTVRFTRPELTLSLDDIYDGVELPTPDEYQRRLRLREEEAIYA